MAEKRLLIWMEPSDVLVCDLRRVASSRSRSTKLKGNPSLFRGAVARRLAACAWSADSWLDEL